MSYSSQLYCPHCEQFVADRTYRRHRSEFYDVSKGTWIRSIHNEFCSPPKKPLHVTTVTESSTKISCPPFIDEYEDQERKNHFLDVKAQRPVYEEEDLESIQLDHVLPFIESSVQEVWEDVLLEDVNADLSEGRNVNRVQGHRNEDHTNVEVIARWTVHFISSWSVFYNVSATALGYLLTFFHAFLSACGLIAPYLLILSNSIPRSVYTVKKTQGILEDDFLKYVVCSKCNELYTLSEAEECRTCTFIKYPNHAQRKFRQKCGEKLLKEVILQDGSRKHYPIKIYCYRSVMKSIQNLLDRPGLKQRCEDWRQRTSIPGTLRDVYDGRVWKSFMTHAGRPFLEMPRRYALQLNVDWFQPYKHSPYSSGGIYLSLMNLPRSERLKKENVITAGVIPGPDEPSLSINTYLRPLVDELIDLWSNGFKYKARDDDQEEEYYVALICCSCDIPATRKIGGFLGHTAKAGCSKCKKNFKTGKFGDKTDYGGFTSTDEPRKDHEHRSIAEEIRQQNNMAAKQKLESKHGVRYTELLRLPYFNAISSFVVDPMHNLFQGTAKYMFKTIWKDKLTGQDLQEIQDIVDNVTVPASFGRIPRKIKSSFSSFTSEQWKNWTLYFSPIALKGHLPKKDFDCWLLFVEACRLLCVSSITIQDLRKGHEKIVEFCRTFESIYGSAMVTPNMHLHIHLVDCILDYGPFHGYWLFGFERMNGVLGSFSTNQRSPEIQFMRKISEIQFVHGLTKLHHLSDLFSSSFKFENTAHSETKDTAVVQRLISLSTGDISRSNDWFCNADISFNGVRHDAFMNDHYLDFLQESVRCILDINEYEISGSCSKYFAMEMCGEKYGSSNSRLSRSSVILASWCGSEGGILKNEFTLRPGVIRFFITFFIKTDDQYKPVNFAFVHWFTNVPYEYNRFVSLWSRGMFEPEGPSSFLPVQRIHGKAICTQTKVRNEIVLAVIPHLRQLFP